MLAFAENLTLVPLSLDMQRRLLIHKQHSVLCSTETVSRGVNQSNLWLITCTDFSLKARDAHHSLCPLGNCKSCTNVMYNVSFHRIYFFSPNKPNWEASHFFSTCFLSHSLPHCSYILIWPP